MVLHRWLSCAVASLSHVCGRSSEVVRAIRGKWLPHDCVMVKFDVKDFYMDGDQSLMIALVLPFLDAAVRPAAELMLNMVLWHQYVVYDTNVYRVTRGSGMGAVHSSSISDLAFYALAERSLNYEALGVLLYLRYRDDIFAVVRSKEAATTLHGHLAKAASACWRVELEGSSAYGMPMLDMMVYKGPSFLRTGRLDHHFYQKPTARHVPLSPWSCHSSSVHRSWPISEVARIRQLCLHDTSFKYYRDRKVARFRSFYLDPAVLAKCAKHRPRLTGIAPEVRPDSLRLIRVVVRYHPGLDRLSSRLNAVCRLWNRLLAGIPKKNPLLGFRVQVAFTRASAPLHVICKRGKL